MSKIIMHIDLNAFFATCEEIEHPEYVGKPIAVAGNTRRGIVSTANYEARKYGVHSAMPTYLAKKICPHLICCGGDFSLYSAMSREFFSFVKHYSKIIEIASIDECFADMTDVLKGVKDVEQYFKNMQMSLYRQTKLKCSIGIAPTKFLAKMASDMKKPMGITILRRKDIPTKLWPLPIEDMFGVGKKTAPRLKKLGIDFIGDLINTTDPEVKKELGSFYGTLIEWANGQGDDVVNVEPFDPKSLGHSSTFMEDTDDYEEMKSLLSTIAQSIAEEAQYKNKKGCTVQIVIKDSEFKTTNRSMTLKEYFNDYETIYNTALKLFEKNYNGDLVRLLGITLQNLVDERDLVVQMTFYDYPKYEEENKTKLLIHEFNRKLNTDTFIRASDVKNKKSS